MASQAQLMRTLMLDLLDLAQVDNNTFTLNKEYFSLPDVIGTAFGIVEHQARTSQVNLVFKKPPAYDAIYFDKVFGD